MSINPEINTNTAYIYDDVAATFAFGEVDDDYGCRYFGARYYDPNISIWLSVDPLSDKYPSHSPYNYVLNNPIKLIDPNGKEVGWVENEGKVFWDEKVNSQKQAVEKYGDQATYHNEVVVRENGTNYQLNSDGSVGSDGGAVPIDRQFTSSRIISSNKAPSPLGGVTFDATIATPGGGYTGEAGLVVSENGRDGAEFLSHGPSYGLEASGAMNFMFIKPKEGFDVSDLQGTSASVTINYGLVSVSLLGNTSPGYPMDNLASTYWGIKIGIGGGIGGSLSPRTNTTFKSWLPDSRNMTWRGWTH